ncbi:MAG TPA: helix-turn-helix domain-containing protein [Kofleriaceae bacterium]|nr:helix-turn-helix domain-containing protein [Kofleriaceae bacterium]
MKRSRVSGRCRTTGLLLPSIWPPRYRATCTWEDHDGDETCALGAGVSATTVRKWIREGLLPVEQVGGRYLVAEDDLEDLLDELEIPEDGDNEEDEDKPGGKANEGDEDEDEE